MNQKEDYSSSPYLCNKLANARMRSVIHDINRLKPAFVIHLGDLVNPVPELGSYVEAAANFQLLVRELEPTLYLTPGNHDVGDKPATWMPAGTVNKDYIALYESHFGKHFYSFDHSDCHFVIINSQILNSGLACEYSQRNWIARDLEANKDKRIFLCTHYPPYVSDPTEPSNYDNIDEPGRSWLLDLVSTYNPEALFAGHVHNFFYDQFGETECYILPSTAFVRHDYSEFFRIAPGEENGRNDEAKLGYFVVRVYVRGHIADNIRTYGATLNPGEKPSRDEQWLNGLHTKECSITSIGVDMRHPWAEEIEIAPSGAVDEFGRKKARNDYPIQALWETGLRKMRVPIQDLLDKRIRRRMHCLKKVGHCFQVYSYGVPPTSACEVLAAHQDLIDVLEIVLPWESTRDALDGIAYLKRMAPVTVYLSRVRTEDDAKFDGSKFNHLISHGFVLEEATRLEDFLLSAGNRANIDGFVFRVSREKSPWQEIHTAEEVSRRLGCTACLYIKSSSANPAEDFKDDFANANRIAEAVAAGISVPNIELVLDTFADADRGYFVRTGLVDRRYNPRLGSFVVKHLFAALQGPKWNLAVKTLRDVPGARVGVLEREAETAFLVLPQGGSEEIRLLIDSMVIGNEGYGTQIDLRSGCISPVKWERRSSEDGDELRYDGASPPSSPFLMIVNR